MVLHSNDVDRRFTVRLDPETARILKELTKRAGGSRTRAIKEALRAKQREGTL
ncbi:MAG: hypothetical protein DMG21_12795 [Acidobacteria bacterium]|nr:MAG: hypothetical protein DMG21_12795 [Acidobacteriota bacterium]